MKKAWDFPIKKGKKKGGSMDTICPCCKQKVPKEDMTTFKGEAMCEGCVETNDMLDHDDPTGRDWRPE